MLPSQVAVKPEKKHQFERRDGDRDDWLMNYFAVWEGKTIGEKLIAQDTDRDGRTTKFVDLPIHQPKGTTITREILVATKNYVQYSVEGEGSDDRADVPIDILTVNLQLVVLVDLDLYRANENKMRDAEVHYQLRNLDFARLNEYRIGFEEDAILWNNGRIPSTSFRPPKSYSRLLAFTQRLARKFETRVLQLTSDDAIARSDGKPIIIAPESREILRSMKSPARFICGCLEWPLPYSNLVVSVAWNKPDRPAD
jgi:hypothetical protein